MNFKFISALYASAISVAILSAPAAKAWNPFQTPQQQVLEEVNRDIDRVFDEIDKGFEEWEERYGSLIFGQGGWIEGGVTDEYSYNSGVVTDNGVKVNVIEYSDGLKGRLILNDDYTGVYSTVPEDGSLPVESKITWDLYSNGNLVFGDDTFHAWFTNAGDFAVN